MSSKPLFQIVLISACICVIILAGYFVWNFISSLREVNPTLITPKGWYMHAQENGGKIFTRQKTLSPIGATEGYAYGEQITFEVIKVDQSREEWITTRFPDDDPLYTRKEEGYLKGPHHFQTVQVEHEVGATGKVLEYYIFIDSNAYAFSLYPLESVDPKTGKAVRNIEGIRALDEMVETYGATFNPPRKI